MPKWSLATISVPVFEIHYTVEKEKKILSKRPGDGRGSKNLRMAAKG